MSIYFSKVNNSKTFLFCSKYRSELQVSQNHSISFLIIFFFFCTVLSTTSQCTTNYLMYKTSTTKFWDNLT